MDLTTLPRTGEIATWTDANQVLDAWRKAEALVKAFRDTETQSHIIKYRNHAMRRLGKMYISIEPQRGVRSDSDPMSRSQFSQSLGISKSDISKITSLAEMDQLEFEMRESQSGMSLWRDTPHGKRMLDDRERVAKQWQSGNENKARVDAVDRLRESIHAKSTPEEVAEAKAKYVADVQEIEQAKVDAIPDVPPMEVKVNTMGVEPDANLRWACNEIIKTHLSADDVKHKDDLYVLIDTTISKLEQIQRGLQS